MRSKLPGILIATVLSGILIVISATAAFGYIKQSRTKVLLSAPNVVRCDRDAIITAKVVSASNGRPVANQTVRWAKTTSPHGRDRLSARATTTNRQGLTRVKLSFGAAAGARRVRATVAGKGSTITVRCAGGLPKTSTLPPAGFEEQPSNALLVPPVTAQAGMSADPLPATAIRMGRLGIDLPLVEGDGYSVPEDVAAHYPGTAWPGEGSNTYVYAHAREGHFLELWQVRTGDLVEMDMADGSVAEYRVSEVNPVAEWDALEYLAPTDSEILTLQTCLTYADTAPRFIVIAERVPSA